MKFDAFDSTQLETQIIKKFEESNPSKFNPTIPFLIKALQTEKVEDEKLSVFEDRLISEAKKILQI
jgi:hypothetical protein